MTSPADASPLSLLCDLVERRSGIYVDNTRRDDLGQHLRERAAKLGHEDREYVSLLATEAGRQELDHVVDLATVNETYFFREPNHFRALVNHILPGLVAQKRTAITIWSAGCSTGEEPYSAAISVLRIQEHLRGASVKILGTDVSPRAIEKARLGVYSRHSFRAIQDADLKRFFLPRPRGYEVREAAKDLCEFKVLNLLEDTGDRFFDGVDVIFCRNVTIYFREPTIRRLNRKLTNTLREGGYLIFGASETLQHQDPELALMEVEGSFLYRKGPPAPETPAPRREPASGRYSRPALTSSSRGTRTVGASAEPRAPAPVAPAPAVPPGDDAWSQVLELLRDDHQDRALPFLERTAAQAGSPHRVSALGLLGNLAINREDFPRALKLLGQALDTAPLRADLYLLAGLAHHYQKDAPGALQRLRRAAFLNPDLYLTHFYMAEVHRASGQAVEAAREYKNTLRLLRKPPTNLPDALLVLTAGFPTDYIARVCERHAGA